MRKILSTVSISLALAVSSFAGGVIPISGFAGCENGLYYPDTGECVLSLTAPNSTGKQGPIFSDTSLIRVILHFRNILF
jgi:hypothetical protein